jgi:hypothetical protein
LTAVFKTLLKPINYFFVDRHRYNFHFMKHFLLPYQNRYNVDYKKHAKCVKCSKLELHWTIVDDQSSNLKARRKMQIEWLELIFFYRFRFFLNSFFFLSDWFVGCHDLSRITAVVDCKRNVKYFFYCWVTRDGIHYFSCLFELYSPKIGILKLNPYQTFLAKPSVSW